MAESNAERIRLARATAALGEERYAVDIRTAHGHALRADEPVSAGGQNSGAGPFELVLAGLGACTAITLRMYAERKTWPLTGLSVDLSYSKDGDAYRIERALHVEGALDAEQKARLAEIAERTPVTLALKAGATIETRLA